MATQLIQTPDGYTEVYPKPSREELQRYYNDKYFGQKETNQNSYSHKYTEEELQHKRVPAAEAVEYVPPNGNTLLEVAPGEGFALDYFASRGWDVAGIDFTDDGLRTYFPSLRTKVQLGDVHECLDALVARGRKFDFVMCNGLLEHVIDPIGLLSRLKAVMAQEGVCRIQVPNDGSWLQQEIVSRGYAIPDFWVCPPDHLNYFNAPGFTHVLKRLGFEIVDLLADFPVDVFLLNPDSCYTRDRRLGRNCHFARVAFEMALWRQSIRALIAFRQGCARAGVGRDLIAYVRAAA